jgi:hypothetical protein
MKLRLTVLLIVFSLWLAAFARAEAPQSAEKMDHSAAQAAPKALPTEAQKSFAILKSLAGSWEGDATMTPAMNSTALAHVDVDLRVASRGNSIVHEIHESGKPDDPAKYDHPITMLYLDGDQLMLTHYCDAGNRPRMSARTSPDGKTVEFDFVDVSGPTKYGHMYHALFTVIDADHHIEEWTFKVPGDKLMKGRLVLQRKSGGSAASGK